MFSSDRADASTSMRLRMAGNAGSALLSVLAPLQAV